MNRTIIINYHYIYDQAPVLPGFRGVTTDLFLKQIAALKKHFEIISLANYVSDRKRPGRFCVLTFDDSLLENYEIVFNILKQEKLLGTFFVPSQPYINQELLNVQRILMLIGKLGVEEFSKKFYSLAKKIGIKREAKTIIDINEAYRYDTLAVRDFKFDLNYQIKYPILGQVLKEVFVKEFGNEQAIVEKIYMTENQLKEMEQAGMGFGIHTHTHRILSRLSKTEQKVEITKAKNFLDKTLDQDSKFISYPFGMPGTINQDTLAVLSGAGIGFGLTVYRQTNNGSEEPLLIHRYDVNDVFETNGDLKENFIG